MHQTKTKKSNVTVVKVTHKSVIGHVRQKGQSMAHKNHKRLKTRSTRNRAALSD